jgi:hypothetical protein
MSIGKAISICVLFQQQRACSVPLTGDEALEEGLLAEVGVVLLEVLLGSGDELDGDELVATLLEARDDITDESTLDTVWLDGDEAGEEGESQQEWTVERGKRRTGGRTSVRWT